MKRFLFLLVVVIFGTSCSFGDKHFLTLTYTPRANTFYSHSEQDEIAKNFKNYIQVAQNHYLQSANAKNALPSTDLILQKIAYIDLLLNYSGLYNITSIDSCSTKVNDNFYLNEYLIKENNDLKKGFIQGLIDMPNKDISHELSIITNNTVFAFDVELNMVEFLNKFPKDNQEFKKFNNLLIDNDIVNLTLEEFAEIASGNIGGLVNYVALNKEEQEKYKLSYSYDFLFSISDSEAKLFNLFCEKAINGRAGKLKTDNNKMLMLNNITPLIAPVLLSRDGYLLVYSNEKAIESLIRDVKIDEYSERLAKFDLPKNINGNGFFYTDKIILPMLATVFPKIQNLYLIAQNIEMENLLIFRKQKSSYLISQYANNDINRLSNLNYSIMLYALLNNHFQNYAKSVDAAHFNELLLEKCNINLKNFYLEQLAPYALKHNGKYPTKEEFEAMNFECPSKKKYIYLEGFSKDSKSNIPIIFDMPENHPDYVNIVFANGDVKTFHIENLRTAKKVVSYLHTLYNYDVMTFSKLLKLIK